MANIVYGGPRSRDYEAGRRTIRPELAPGVYQRQLDRLIIELACGTDEEEGVEALIDIATRGACLCEPCDYCVDGYPHDVPHDCLDYQCFRCDCREALGWDEVDDE